MTVTGRVFTFPDPGTAFLVQKGRGQVYRTPKGDYKRVTSVLESLPKQRFLVPWAADKERAACLEAARIVVQETAFLDIARAGGETTQQLAQGFVASMEDHLGPAREHQKLKEKGGDIGGEIHEEIQRRTRAMLGLEPGPEFQIRPEALLAVMAWEDWLKGSKLRPVACEQVVWSDELEVGGTVDLFALDERDRLGIVDYKSSKAIYDEMHVQVATYCKCSRERGIPVEWAQFVRLPKTVDDPIFKNSGPPIETKPLGEMYSNSSKKKILTEEELMAVFSAAKVINSTL